MTTAISCFEENGLEKRSVSLPKDQINNKRSTANKTYTSEKLHPELRVSRDSLSDDDEVVCIVVDTCFCEEVCVCAVWVEYEEQIYTLQATTLMGSLSIDACFCTPCIACYTNILYTRYIAC